MDRKEIALITGAAGGIGEAISKKFLQEGYKVYLNCSSENSYKKLQEFKNTAPNDIEIVRADISKSDEIKNMFSYLLEKDGAIDVLVNNAGVTADGLAIRMTDSMFDKTIDTNLKGTFYASREALSIMAKQKKGSIVNISSIVGLHGNAGQCNYSASKAGIIGLTKSLAREYASRGIRVNAIAPGAVDTAMISSLPDSIKEAMLSSIPLKRFASPSEIAEAVFYIANAKYITGQVLSIDGGMSI